MLAEWTMGSGPTTGPPASSPLIWAKRVLYLAEEKRKLHPG